MPVNKFWVTGRLPLTKVLDLSELVVCNGFHILNNFLDDDSLWVSIFDTLVVHSLGSTI